MKFLPYYLRPEDFRHAWSNAYTSAMIHSAKIHSAMDQQMKSICAATAECSMMNKATQVDVRDTAISIGAVMQKLSDLQIDALKKESRKFIFTIERLSEDYVKKSKAIEARFNELAAEREHFEARRREMFNRPWYRRIWDAIRHKQ